MTLLSKASITSTERDFLHRIRAGHYDLVTDEPEALAGEGQGPAPFDLYLASLAACTAIAARMYQPQGMGLGPVPRRPGSAQGRGGSHLGVQPRYVQK
jgi:putative redox protein